LKGCGPRCADPVPPGGPTDILSVLRLRRHRTYQNKPTSKAASARPAAGGRQSQGTVAKAQSPEDTGGKLRGSPIRGRYRREAATHLNQ
jgi:hypothetical protein